MPLVEDDHVVEQIASTTSHPTLRHSVLPRTAKGGAHGQASYPFGEQHHVVAELRVAVGQKEPRRRRVRPRLSHLLHDPECVGISRDIEAENPSPIMPDDEKAVQDTKGKGWDGEEIYGCDGVTVIPQEPQPRLGRIQVSRSSSKPSRYRRFRDAEPQLEQFA